MDTFRVRWVRWAEGTILRPGRMALALLLLAATIGCEGRERTNPFDPANEDTHGRPEAARASAACGRVELTWRALGMTDLFGERVWRRVGSSSVLELLTVAPLHPSQSAFTDSSAPNEVAIVYEVELLFEGGSTAFLSAVEARAGAALPWCCDPCGSGLALLAPDGRTLRRSLGAGGTILDLDVDLQGHRVFAASLYGPSAVLIVESDGADIVDEIPMTGPSAVSWSSSAGALAVAAFNDQRVDWILPSGEVIASLSSPGWYPEDVAFRDLNRTWIVLSNAELSRGLLIAADIISARRDTLSDSLTRPVAVVDDPAGPGCWVADRGGWVLHVDDAMTARRTAAGAFSEPTDLDADGEACWVADPTGGRIARVDRAAAVQASYAGWSGAWGVTCDTTLHSLWVAQPDRGQVVRLDVSGESPVEVGRATLSGCPNKVAGDWSGGCR